MENKEEIIQPLSDEEMEQAVGGANILQPGQYFKCEACGKFYDGDEGDEVPYYNGFVGCSCCGGSLKYFDRRRRYW